MTSAGCCLDCHGTGQLCVLCWLPTTECECPDAHFAGEFEQPKVIE
jgi:hypothetical protein